MFPLGKQPCVRISHTAAGKNIPICKCRQVLGGKGGRYTSWKAGACSDWERERMTDRTDLLTGKLGLVGRALLQEFIVYRTGGGGSGGLCRRAGLQLEAGQASVSSSYPACPFGTWGRLCRPRGSEAFSLWHGRAYVKDTHSGLHCSLHIHTRPRRSPQLPHGVVRASLCCHTVRLRLALNSRC